MMKRVGLAILAAYLLLAAPQIGYGTLNLGVGQMVQVGGVDIEALTYSVPSFVDWNNDGLKDLIVGEGGYFVTPRIKLLLNDGTTSAPHFSEASYLTKSNGEEIGFTGSECTCSAVGLFPRVVDWNNDARKDMVVGQLDGTIVLYTNSGTDASPVFEDGVLLQVGAAGFKMDIDIGDVANPTVTDWNNDGKKDLLVGTNDGRIRLFVNEGSNAAPDFVKGVLLQDGGADLDVNPGGSSPEVFDLDGDGDKDLLSGVATGEILFYSNIGTDAAPEFSGYTLLEAAGSVIDVDTITGASPRSRPYMTDWTDDGLMDIVVGAGDGKVYLFQSVPEVGTLILLAGGGLAALRRRRAREDHVM